MLFTGRTEMAIKELMSTNNLKNTRIADSDEPRKSAPIFLTAEEITALYEYLATPPPPLSAETKAAIADYKRIKALRVR